jgi:hypothetical protein
LRWAAIIWVLHLLPRLTNYHHPQQRRTNVREVFKMSASVAERPHGDEGGDREDEVVSRFGVSLNSTWGGALPWVR